tara:strand:- start:29293 stop:30156 length:864 start_codon:yes stop_codon:yes gene_type:complete
MAKKQVALWVLLAMVGVSMLTGIAAVIMPNNLIDDRVLFSILIIGLYALGGLVVVASARKMRMTYRVCSGFMIASMFGYLLTIWLEPFISYDTEDLLFRISFGGLVVSFVLLHRLLICPLVASNQITRIAKRTAIITGITTGAGVVSLLMFDDVIFSSSNLIELIVRLLGISVIVCAGSTIATGALVIFGPKPGDDEPGLLESSIVVSMTCPRCQSGIEAKSNRETRCGSCRLKVLVEIEEPRCKCGYLLYELESDTCPECGQLIPTDDRWGQKDKSFVGHEAPDPA